MVRTKSFLAATSCAFALVVAGAAPALAGEVNGNGERVPRSTRPTRSASSPV